ncbi:efflux RND transporter periplasmic adaptor subunit [Marivita hallyeonensis]|uniref:RND family efflux transporter, MFP subunit n=1 Tax=Marivita hallyeonensis TaxID=996342 RepID=A0A1M5X1L2_9RHOB|nr:efflux RND transporter periplasmic adaptor subunit [Marivita hallyeonensis]SHH93699.1 RND family efflux transporter, MFP subunit [Marivita hallyeonensis]
MAVRSLIFFSVFGAAILGGGIAALIWAGNETEAPQSQTRLPPLVTVATVTEVTRPPALLTTGFVRPSDPLTLTTEVAGRVEFIHPDFETGGRIDADTPVVRLGRTPYEAELMRAESLRMSAEAALMQAENALERQRQLAANNFASDARIEELEAARAAAQADLGSARASVTIAQDQVADTSLSLPYVALVTSEDISPGALVQPGQRIGDVVRADRAELRTSLTERDYRRFAANGGIIGKTVIVRLRDSDASREAEITAVSPQLGGATRMVEIIATITDPFEGENKLLLNALVDVEIPFNDTQRSVLSVPSSALQTRQRLWRVDEDLRLRPVDFVIERRTEDTLFLLSDEIAPGDRVLTTALQTQIEGREVRIDETDGS